MFMKRDGEGEHFGVDFLGLLPGEYLSKGQLHRPPLATQRAGPILETFFTPILQIKKPRPERMRHASPPRL